MLQEKLLKQHYLATKGNYYPIFFFLIGNKTFIEKKNWTSCSQWWTLWTLKQIQEDQELKEIQTKKSATAVQFVHPQTRAQRNRVRKSKIIIPKNKTKNIKCMTGW